MFDIDFYFSHYIGQYEESLIALKWQYLATTTAFNKAYNPKKAQDNMQYVQKRSLIVTKPLNHHI